MKTDTERQRTRDTMMFVGGFFLLGVILVAVGRYRLLLEEHAVTWNRLWPHLVLELGMAVVIASVVAAIFELFLSQHRMRELSALIGDAEQTYYFGFRTIYATRQDVFNTLFEEALAGARNSIRVMGICVSLFKEAERPVRAGKRQFDELIEVLLQRLGAGVQVQVLFLRRYPSVDELRQYGVSDADFFYMRERDEDTDDAFQHGRRLKKIANRSVGSWIDVLVRLAEKVRSRSEADRRVILERLQIREYLAMPSLSLVIIDDDIYVTPYLYKRHCSDVPTFKVSGHETILYLSYSTHFNVTWEASGLTVPAIPPEFIDLLISKPDETVAQYRYLSSAIEDICYRASLQNDTFGESAERYRVEEIAVAQVLHRSGFP